MPRCTRKPAGGYTVIELMITVAVVAIMLAIGIPGFQQYMLSYRTTTQANDLLADLALARSEAVKFSQNVEVRAAGGGWAAGWTVGVDLNRNGAIDAGTEEILREHAAAEPDFTMPSATALIAFDATGTRVLPAGNAVATIAVCPPVEAPNARQIRIERVGRAESNKVTRSSAC